VSDKAHTRLGPVRNLQTADLSIRWNAPGDFSFDVDLDEPMLPALGTEGARCRAVYVRQDGTRRTLFSGPVFDVAGRGIGPSATRTIAVDDDWQKLNELLGWPSPTSAITAQGGEGAYWKSPAATSLETAFRNLLVAALTRLDIGLDAPASSLARGGNQILMSRMHTMVERNLDAFNAAGLGIRVLQGETSTADPLVSIYQGVTRKTVYEGSGAIEDVEFHRSAPTATRLVLGLGGEAEAREFRSIIDTALEALWGQKKEIFVDARDIALDDPNLTTLVAERAAEKLAEAGPKVTLSAKMVQSENFQFETGFDLGDTLPIKLDGVDLMSDRVTEIGFAYNKDADLTITPLVGDWTEDEMTAGVYKAAGRLARSVSNLEKGL